jgi:hypothetical protein
MTLIVHTKPDVKIRDDGSATSDAACGSNVKA